MKKILKGPNIKLGSHDEKVYPSVLNEICGGF